MKTVWEYSEKTEALRLLHDAHYVAVGFYRVNNFIVLPFPSDYVSPNLVTFPDLPYYKIPRFWDRVKRVKGDDLPIKAEPKFLKETISLLNSSNLPKPEYSATKKAWELSQDKVLEQIYKIMPNKKGLIKKITIYPTIFGTGASFNWADKTGEVIMYLREDRGISEIAEAIVTSITRRDIYDKLNGMWQESEIITDWLITESSLSSIVKKYDKTSYTPTIKGTRVKQQAKLLATSEAFYKKLGFSPNTKIFSLNGLTPEINKRPVENLSSTEKTILKLLIDKAEGVVNFDEIANEIFKDDQNFSLYAIAKNIERLRNKLEANGVSGSYIQTLRGKGYLLKN